MMPSAMFTASTRSWGRQLVRAAATSDIGDISCPKLPSFAQVPTQGPSPRQQGKKKCKQTVSRCTAAPQGPERSQCQPALESGHTHMHSPELQVTSAAPLLAHGQGQRPRGQHSTLSSLGKHHSFYYKNSNLCIPDTFMAVNPGSETSNEAVLKVTVIEVKRSVS